MTAFARAESQDRPAAGWHDPRSADSSDLQEVTDGVPRASIDAGVDSSGEWSVGEPGSGGELSGERDDDGSDDDLRGFEAALPPEIPDMWAEDPPEDDPDPTTYGVEGVEVDDREPLETEVYNVVGVKFSASGRIGLYDAGDRAYQRGERVVVEAERGVRLGVVAVDSRQRIYKKRTLKQVVRRPNRNDLRTIERNEERSARALGLAREAAREQQLPIKVFRAEYTHSGNKVLVYFTAEQRIDFRDLVRELSGKLKSRIEMRQTGVRDEAKMTGGIGSCGRELCCTTWLPEFVPVSIKMAKDQGLVLNPTKVSGQCGRLKCCLVYEQATYAELRKGLPKLGKRVITEAGEGRVVEVDVLRQRVRVSLGPGESQIFAGHEVKPMFPSQPQKKRR